MALDSLEKDIRSLLESNPRGLGFNEIHRELGVSGSSPAKGTLKLRLDRMTKASTLKVEHGSRNKTTYKMNTELLKQIEDRWLQKFLLFSLLLDKLNEIRLSSDPKENKMTTAAFLVSQQFSLLILRSFKLEQRKGLRIDVEREEALNAALAQGLKAAMERFIAKLGVTLAQYDTALESAEELSNEGLLYSISFRRISGADSLRKMFDEFASIAQPARDHRKAKGTLLELIETSSSNSKFRSLLSNTPEEIERSLLALVNSKFA
jgi:DNA-binding Lrp family transcriptional regulator